MSTLKAGSVTESWGSLDNPAQKQGGTRRQSREEHMCNTRMLPLASSLLHPGPMGSLGPCSTWDRAPSPIRPWSCQSCHCPSRSDPLQACWGGGGDGPHSCRAGTELPFRPRPRAGPRASLLHPEARAEHGAVARLLQGDQGSELAGPGPESRPSSCKLGVPGLVAIPSEPVSPSVRRAIEAPLLRQLGGRAWRAQQ